MGCGASLSTTVTSAAGEAASGVGDERRRVTILFADLSGYTAIAERLDPEVVKGVVSRILRRLASEVDANGGTVDKFIGDNVMALFGAPVAHEDDAVRAVRAALGMQAAMDEINEELERTQGVRFALRVGINTGPVLYGTIGTSTTVTGDAVNVAARLQAASELGAVTVGERTMLGARHAVAFTQIAPLELKGKAELVPAHTADALLQPHVIRRPATESPLVGRQSELSLVCDAQQRSEEEARARLLTIIGPAGAGKSRLLHEARRVLAERDTPPTLHEGRCPAYGSAVFWPVTEILRAEAALEDAEEASDKLVGHLEMLLERAGEDDVAVRERTARLIARVLGYEAEPTVSLDSDDPQRLHDRFFTAVRSVVEAMAARRPVVLAFEDIHWADDGVLDLIEYLTRAVHGPVLILCFTREDLFERRVHWGSAEHAERHVLEPLDVDEAAELITALLPADQVALAAAVAERAGGNPLFAEELARSVAEDGAAYDRLPDTVQAVLASRLDSLRPVERRVVQCAAVIGRTFSLETLGLLAREECADLDEVLAVLQTKKILVRERPGSTLGGTGEFGFRHALIRDVAYETLPKAVRAHRHLELGELLEAEAGDHGDAPAATLAEHFDRAATLGRETGLDAAWLLDTGGRAAGFHEAAAAAAAAVGSNREAAGHLEAAARLAPDEGPAQARIAEQLGDICVRMGRTAAAVERWQGALARQRIEGNSVRAADLLRKIGGALGRQGERRQAIEHFQMGIDMIRDRPPERELARLYEEAAAVHLEAGDSMLAIYAAEKALRLAQILESPRAAGRAHGIFGQVFARMGDTQKARQNLELSVDLARGSDAFETVHALVALAHQCASAEADLAGADAAYGEALDLANALGDAPAQVTVHCGRAQVAALRGDWDTVSRAIAVIEELEDLGRHTALPLVLGGALAWRSGDLPRAAELYRRAHALAEDAGWSDIAAAALDGLAVSLRDSGDLLGAVDAYDRALVVCERAGMVGRTVQTTAARAVLLAIAGQPLAAREGAREAAEAAARLREPAAQVAVKEAAGATAEGGDGAALLLQAAAEWAGLGRPLDAARCEALAARALKATRPQVAAATAEKAAATFERLGVWHLAASVRAPSPAD